MSNLLNNFDLSTPEVSTYFRPYQSSFDQKFELAVDYGLFNFLKF